MLLAFGANINARGWWGSTALIKSLVEKNLQMARIILSYEANIDACTNERRTALMAATFDIDFTKELLCRSKYSLHQQDIFGNTALHHAVQNKHLDVASLLVKSGINPLTPNHKGVDSLTLVKECRKKLMGVPPVCRRLQFASFGERTTNTSQCTDLYYFDPEEHDCPDRDGCGDWDFVDSNPLKDLPDFDHNQLQASYYRK
ncbi:26S proteasome non-ATPase regulatory subunit 10-like [Octopus vulgaris]|uniref:26S proteasome non-ATPase regulatory subunit 10-like n=1 Tax=Octopus vulgaris TaxID=6645 RepID=A0AA36BV76_OCTVU|nr:26S proteasome non-ATPase regulatory subunit 10-like [Octopus vulgaris]